MGYRESKNLVGQITIGVFAPIFAGVDRGDVVRSSKSIQYMNSC